MKYINIKFLVQNSSQHKKPTEYESGKVVTVYRKKLGNIAHFVATVSTRVSPLIINQNLQYEVRQRPDLAVGDAHQ